MKYDDPDINGEADKFLASILILCMVVGIPINILSCVFFYKRSKRRNKTLHDLLYMKTSATDTCTLLTAFGPISVLISDTNRSAMLFSNGAFCRLWTVIFYFVTRFSLFLAMMLSICRTLAISAPFFNIKWSILSSTCIIYGIWLFSKDAIFIGIGAISVNNYDEDWASCIHVFYYDSLGFVYVVFVAIELLVVLLVIFINFILCFLFLARRSSVNNIRGGVNFDKASRSITIFTVVCLTCSLPIFIVLVLTILHIDRTLDPLVLSYLRFGSYVFFTVLNASLNPCIYVTLFPAYKEWVTGLLRKFYFGKICFTNRVAVTERSVANTSGSNHKPALETGLVR